MQHIDIFKVKSVNFEDVSSGKISFWVYFRIAMGYDKPLKKVVYAYKLFLGEKCERSLAYFFQKNDIFWKNRIFQKKYEEAKLRRNLKDFHHKLTLN